MNCPYSYCYETIDSTQDEAKRLIKAGKIKNVACISANSQTYGRGTNGRKWSSPEGSGIYLSIIHIPQNKNLFNLTTVYTQAAGISCIEAIQEMTRIEAKVKPVNDIYYAGKKLGGILIESMLQGEKIAYLITGIGINIKEARYELDRDTVKPTSIEGILSKNDFNCFVKGNLVEKIVDKICFWYDKVFDGNHDLILEKWESLKI